MFNNLISRKPNFGKIILSSVLSIVLLSLFVSIGMAGEAAPHAPQPSGDICVEGTVINHEEIPQDGWIIVATFIDANGEPDLTSSISAVSFTELDDDETIDDIDEEDRDGKFEFEEGLFPGTWRFQIELQEGWEPVTPDIFEVELDYGKSRCGEIRFKVKEVVDVIVLKIDSDHNPLPDWVIRARPVEDNYFAESKEIETDGEGRATFRLTPGKWRFTEAPPEDVEYESVVPSKRGQILDVEPPGPLVIRFKNRIINTGCVEVFKFDVPPNGGDSFGLQGWDIKIKRADGTIAVRGETDAFGRVEFDNLPFGPYTIVEETRSGWKSVTPSSFDVVLKDTQCEIITFYNEQDGPYFCIEGSKIDDNGDVGIPGWEFTAEPLAKGGYEPEPVFTDGFGDFKFLLPADDYRIPGARYEVCEEERDGWVSQGSLCRTVTLPQEPGKCVELDEFVNVQVGHEEANEPEDDEEEEEVVEEDENGCRKIHTVMRGDSLYGIGNKYNVSSKAMVEANPFVKRQRHYFLYVGQQVCIP